MREFPPYLGSRVLEVGAGIGQFTQLVHAQPSVRDVLAIEPDPRICREFRARNPDIPVSEGTVQSVKPTPDWDTVISVNVLEHIEHDIEELRAYEELLRQRRGRLCLFVPARPEIYSPLDRDFGHFRRYRRPDLAGKLRDAGFRPIALFYFNLVGYAAWWWSFCVLRQRTFNLAAVRLFDRGIFPISSFLEHHLLRPPIGQSLVAIAEAGR
jgi:SAM-dependent methyltransferase